MSSKVNCKLARFHLVGQVLFSFQIVIEGMSLATLIHFDNVSFGAECCNEIPWAPYKGIVYRHVP